MLPSPIQALTHPLFTKHQLQVFIKRDDLIHPIISGNKWRKLQGNIEYAKANDYSGILSFGGAFSNHIHALAYACQQQQLKTIGIIRGEPEYQHNYTLSWAKHWQMQLNFVDRITYKRRYQQDYLDELTSQYPDYFIVPEGGTNQLALTGMAGVIDELTNQLEFDSLMLPIASGGTTAGLIAADNGEHQILSIAVLKQAEYLLQEIKALLPNGATSTNWRLLTEFHRGGYAKFSAEDCINLAELTTHFNVPFEPIYSGKMLLALLDLIEQGYFPAGHRIVLLHTGGIQGVSGLINQNRVPEQYIKAIQSHLPSVPRVQ
ncbi:1-aminocyclopropane-1-carboxylate deaminase/D-cysteine desulfhydrase [Colwellia sp. MEBiC06753]